MKYSVLRSLVLAGLISILLVACLGGPVKSVTTAPTEVVSAATATAETAPTQIMLAQPTAQPMPTVVPAASEEVMTVLEAINTPPQDLPQTIEGNPPADFGALGIYVRQVMEDVVNYRVKGAEMSYTCPANGDLFISMDPGKFLGLSLKNGGVIHYPCNKDEKVTLSTPHWSDGEPSHQQVTVAFSADFPTFAGDTTWDQRDALLLYQKNEGKAEAYNYYLDASGKMQYELITK